jgi:L-cysteine S-thiosulfotransferase
MKNIVAILGLCLALPGWAGPEEDLAALRDFYSKRFPDIELSAHKDGAYALDESKREQWLEMEEFPPYEIAVDDGADLYGQSFANGGSYGACLGEGAPAVKDQYPFFDTVKGEVVTLELALNNCRTAAGEEALDWDSEELAAVVAYIAMESRGQSMSVDVPDDPRAIAAYEDGKKFYYQRRGQLNFACSSCHLQSVGMMLRAERLSATIGHATHWPVYRGKWQRVGVLHRRFQECNSQVRAESFDMQSTEYRNLEYFLSYMNNGMELNGPASRK